MPYDSKHFSERQRRERRKIAGMVACINNTKWREVFLCASRHNLWFQIDWVHSSDWDTDALHSLIAERLIGTDRLHDPGIGGPCLYSTILWIRWPRVLRPNGRVQLTFDAFRAELAGLGMLPIDQTNESIEIWGYRESGA